MKLNDLLVDLVFLKNPAILTALLLNYRDLQKPPQMHLNKKHIMKKVMMDRF
jgi:hypothetical protein